MKIDHRLTLTQHTSSASGGENSGISFADGRPTEAFGANTLDIPKKIYLSFFLCNKNESPYIFKK